MQFGWFGTIVKEVGGKLIGVHVHLCRPGQEMDFVVIVLVAFCMEMLEGDAECGDEVKSSATFGFETSCKALGWVDPEATESSQLFPMQRRWQVQSDTFV
jgi:hypothetical protein